VATVTLSGGEKLKAKLAELAGKVGRGGVLHVGFLANATYPDGLQVAQVAFWNEFGTVNQVPRPFFRRMIRACSGRWGAELGAVLKATGFDVKRSLAQMGTRIKDQLVESINELTSPPLKASTIRRKGFDKPLIDTAVMVRSSDFVVKD
jgi:hypothetical protein